MPIANTTVSADDFTDLQQNISDQSAQYAEAAALASSGLSIIVGLNAAAPEVDLIERFATHFTNLESYDSSSNFTQVVAALNSHVIFRGTTATAGETMSDRLNRWLYDNTVLVTQTYADLSSGAGFVISESNIEA